MVDRWWWYWVNWVEKIQFFPPFLFFTFPDSSSCTSFPLFSSSSSLSTIFIYGMLSRVEKVNWFDDMMRNLTSLSIESVKRKCNKPRELNYISTLWELALRSFGSALWLEMSILFFLFVYTSYIGKYRYFIHVECGEILINYAYTCTYLTHFTHG